MFTHFIERFRGLRLLSLFIILTFNSVFAPSLFASVAEDYSEEQIIQDWIRATRAKAKSAGICENYVTNSPHYESSTIFMGEAEPAKISLKPEAGSIEDRFPGTVEKLTDIRLKLLEAVKLLPPIETLNAGTVDPIMKDLSARVAAITEKVPDPRFQTIAGDFQKYLQKRHAIFQTQEHHTQLALQLNMVAAGMWELMMACFFDGEWIGLNRQAATIYQAEFSRLKASTRVKDELDREIDIAIKRRDGTWRWIEVKNWSPRMADTPKRVDKVVNQSLGQNELRQKLNLNVETTLLMKYGWAGIVFLHVKLHSKFDQILFAFPTGK